MQEYLGNVIIRTASDEEKLTRLPPGVEYSRMGGLVQLYGPSEYRQAFAKTSTFRDVTLHSVRRDRVVLLKDSQRIMSILGERALEEIRSLEVPDIKLNGLTTNGAGHTLEIIDTFRNSTLQIQVSHAPDECMDWITWRVSEVLSQTKEILKEKAIPYPKGEFDDAKMWDKAVTSIFKEVKSWLKDRV